MLAYHIPSHQLVVKAQTQHRMQRGRLHVDTRECDWRTLNIRLTLIQHRALWIMTYDYSVSDGGVNEGV